MELGKEELGIACICILFLFAIFSPMVKTASLCKLDKIASHALWYWWMDYIPKNDAQLTDSFALPLLVLELLLDFVQAIDVSMPFGIARI